jgi:hypothetical protein
MRALRKRNSGLGSYFRSMQFAERVYGALAFAEEERG